MTASPVPPAIVAALYPGQPDARPSVEDVCAEIEGLRQRSVGARLADARLAAAEAWEVAAKLVEAGEAPLCDDWQTTQRDMADWLRDLASKARTGAKS